MTTIEEVLFRTPQDALIFAFNYSLQTRDRSAMDRLAAPSPRTGKGLSGNDGAGQSGMIRRRLKELSDLDVAILTACIAPRSFPCACRAPCCSGRRVNPEYADAVSYLTEKALPLFAGKLSHRRLRQALIEKAVARKSDKTLTIKSIATLCEVADNTADAHWRIIRQWIQGTSRQRSKKKLKRARIAAGAAVTDVGQPDEGDGADNQSAIDGIESAARKHADELLSGLPFIRA